METSRVTTLALMATASWAIAETSQSHNHSASPSDANQRPIKEHREWASGPSINFMTNAVLENLLEKDLRF
jgi:hypothetical protein